MGTLYNPNAGATRHRWSPLCQLRQTIHFTLPHANRASLASVALVPKAVYGCPYHYLRRIDHFLIGKKHKTRSPLPFYRLRTKDICSTHGIRCSSLRNLFAGAVKLPYLVSCLNRILALRQNKNSRIPLDTGPIGLAIRESFRWGTVLAESRTAGMTSASNDEWH